MYLFEGEYISADDVIAFCLLRIIKYGGVSLRKAYVYINFKRINRYQH